MESSAPSYPPLHYDPRASLHGFLEDAADRYGQRVALRHGDEALSYRELDGLSNAMANLLAARGVRQGDRVAVLCSNRPEFSVTAFGALKLGASVVMLSQAWKPAELAPALALTRPALVVCDGDAPDRLDGSADTASVLHLDHDAVGATLLAGSGRRPDVELDWAEREAVLVFSSGTTGLPKAVRHTHASLVAGTLHWASALGLTDDDRFQVATPPFHILGLMNILASVSAGACVRLHTRFDLDRVLQAIERDRITLEMAVAPIAIAMANHPNLEAYDLSSLRYLMWCATPVTASVAETITRRTGVPVMAAYGASELPVLTCNPVRRPERWRLDSPGLPVHDVRLRVVDLETGAVLPPGQTGEIQARSPSTMAGYLPAEADADAFVDGWYRTGDVGWLEPDGWLHLTDRVKEMIKVRGFQVAPAEVEAVLHGHPAVADCAVYGVPDEQSGEAVVAAVQLVPGAAPAEGELEALVAERLASYKRITRLHVVDAIPRLPSGKVLRRVLREQLDGTPVRA